MDKLRLQLNKKLDEQMIEQFLEQRGGGIDFGAGVIETHPQLQAVRSVENISQKQEVIHNYVSHYYQAHQIAIHHSMDRFRQAWRLKEQEYIAITEELFGGYSFPSGQYIAYISIINCNPRFLDTKTFQVFYQKSTADAVHTIAHELLHFIFYDFVKEELQPETGILSVDQLWDLSEIFNVVVLRSPRYSHLIDQRLVTPYPDHQQYTSQFDQIYQNSADIEEFIRQGVDIIKTKK